MKRKITKIEDINCYSDACLVLGIKPFLHAHVSYKLKTIIRACNYIDNDFKYWKPDFSDGRQYKYIPYFYYDNFLGGWSLVCAYCYSSSSYDAVAFYYKEESTARYIANKFIEVYKLHLNS